MKGYEAENFGLLKNVVSTGNSIILTIGYIDASDWPRFFEIECGIYGAETEEDRRIYWELFGLILREDEAENFALDEVPIGVAGDIVAASFEYNQVLYFTGQPGKDGAYTLDQIHSATSDLKIPLDYRKSLDRLALVKQL